MAKDVSRRVVVVGAGAAGTMAAIFAAEGGAETLLLERTADGGRKILVSGGGRCNLLPVEVDESRFVTDSSPHTLRRILRSWPLVDQVAFFERDLGLPLVMEEGKRFPASGSALDVRDRLLARAAERGVKIVRGRFVTGLVRDRGAWRVDLEGRPSLEADAVVLATGGLSFPETGSDGTGLAIAANLGLRLHPTYPALTPLKAEPSPFTGLQGVSLPVRISASDGGRSAAATGGFLFTHSGYSGPAVLDLSHVAVRSHGTPSPAHLRVQWADLDEAGWEAELRSGGARTVQAVLRGHLPERLVSALLAGAGGNPACRVAELPRAERRRLVEALVRCDLPWSGYEGYDRAEVTGGGVSLSEIDPATMESRRHPGLYLSGEMLDAFGPIGGHNFLWAWVTGRAAGRAAASGGIRTLPGRSSS